MRVDERPILYAAPMVRAILAGTKTQTRRVISQVVGLDAHLVGCSKWAFHVQDGRGFFVNSRYGQVGDRLYVKETWAPRHESTRDRGLVSYRATEAHPPAGERWRPSIFMPRWASRITLEITGLRVERLQEITEDDAIAEGIGALSLAELVAASPQGSAFPLPRLGTSAEAIALARFPLLWDGINGKREGCSWKANPWVWVIEFRRVEGRP